MSASTSVTNSILLCFPKAILQGSCPLNKLLILPNSRFLASSSSSKGPITNTSLTPPQADANNNSSFPNYPLVDGKETQPTASVRRRPSWWTASWGTADNNNSKGKKEIPSAAAMGSSTSPAADTSTATATNSTTATAANTSVQQQNTIVHVVKGGLPCDSVPQFQLSNYGKEALYTLVLLRHGESEWNLQNKFTGWCDVQLTERGRQEAHDAGRLLRQNGIEIDHAFTSYLQRACFTTNMALNTSRQFWVPVTKSWRLNERHYGALQGYNKDTAWSELGLDQELVMEMRRSYDVSPPLMNDDHPHWHGTDRRYKILSQEQLDQTRGESLKDAAGRIIPFYEKVIIPSMAAGNKCLVVSHANTLRTLIKYIDNISDEDIKGMTIPTGIPLLYRLDAKFQAVCPFQAMELTKDTLAKGYTWATSRRYGFQGVYLGDFARLQEIQRKRDISNRDWQRIILRNVAKSLLEANTATSTVQNGIAIHSRPYNNLNKRNNEQQLMDTRQLWWKIRAKMNEKSEFSNMMLLSRMMEYLEKLMTKGRRRDRFISMASFEKSLHEIHLDTTGKVVEPFEELKAGRKGGNDYEDDDYTMAEDFLYDEISTTEDNL